MALGIATTVGRRWRRRPPMWASPGWPHPTWAYPLLVRLYGASFLLPIPRPIRRWALRMVHRTAILGCSAVIAEAGTGEAGPTFLFARHRYPHGEHGEVWALPSGGVGHEPLAQALVRELQEELGLTVSVGRLLAVDASLSDEVTFYFACHIMAGQFRPSAEVAEVRYFPPDTSTPSVDRTHLALLRRIIAERGRDSTEPILLP